MTLPLLCALGRHKTDGLARWNAGYYFARCTRCRRDLVRTAFTRWQIPRGFRVVWQGEAGAGHAPSSEPLRQPAPERQVEFPIREEVAFVAAADQEPEAIAPADPVMAYAEAEPDESMADADVTTPTAKAHVPIEDVLRSVPGLTEPLTEGSDAHSEDGGWFEEHRFEEEDVRFEPHDRLQDFAPADDAPEDSVEEPETPVEAQAEVMEDIVEDEPSLPPAPPVSSKYPVVPDFMDEGPAGIAWDAVSGHIVPRYDPAAPQVQEARDVPPGLLTQGWQELVRKRAQAAGDQGREWLRSKRASKSRIALDPRSVAAIAPEAPGSHKPQITVSDEAPGPVAGAPAERSSRFGHFLMNQGAIVAATIFGGLVLAASVIDSRNGATRTVTRPVAVVPVAPAVVTPPAAKPGALAWKPSYPRSAFVTAGLLNCRATASNDAETVRRLSRGAPVQILATSPGWASIAHQGRQCWVSAQHISAKRPA